jgi:hypothetical protein
MESLLFLNEQSAKFMDWQVRILHPRLIKYQFTTKKNEVVNATRFQAYLVGGKPSEYVMATVPFSFKDEQKPSRSAQRFQDKTCWKFSSVLLESNSKAQWNGCPNKAVVILDAPTQMNPLMQGGVEEKALAHFIEPEMKLADILEAFGIAKNVSYKKHIINACVVLFFLLFCEVQTTQAVDCSVFIIEVERHRTEVARGKQVSVCTITVVDDSNSRASITCWEDQAVAMQGCAGQAATILGMIVVKDDNEVKLSIRSSAIVDFTNTPRHAALTDYVKSRDDSTQLVSVTQTWTPSSQTPSCDGEALLACASFLRATGRDEHYAMNSPFQLMGAFASANLADIYTKDGKRLFVQGILRDWSGSVQVSFLDSCALTLFDCRTKEEVDQKLQDNTLSIISNAINVRGLKVGVELHVVQITVADVFVELSKTALRLAELAAFCGPSTDGVLTCSATQLVKTNLSNLSVLIEKGSVVAPHRAVLLVQGTEKSKLIVAGTTQAARIIVSENVKCLLSESDTFVHLRAYASEDMLLDYKLDRRVAVVYVTALHKEKDFMTCIVDRMEPLDDSSETMDKVKRYMKVMQQMSTGPRNMKDIKLALQFVTPESMKRARTISAYPSDA